MPDLNDARFNVNNLLIARERVVEGMNVKSKPKVVKLNEKQLRSLITEAIMGRQPGEPLFVPVIEKSGLAESSPSYVTADDVAYAASASARKYFGSLYRSDDPSIEAAGGKDVWDEQVEGAVYELESRLAQVVEEITVKLVNGEYLEWR